MTFLLLIYKKFIDIPSIFPFHPPKISDDFFLVISSISYVSPLLNTSQPTFCIIHSQNFPLFTILFYAFPLLQSQI